MSQSTFRFDENGSGAIVLQNMSEAVQALASSNQGSTEPTVTTPSMLWADEASGLLKIRSTNNTKWWVVGTLNEDGLGLGSRVGHYLISPYDAEPKHEKCLGGEVSRTTFSALFAVIGTKFGIGNGTTTFNLPDARDRALVFPNSDATKGLIRDVGDKFGENTHAMTESELATHSHRYARRNSGTQSGTPSAFYNDNGGSGYVENETGSIRTAGSGTPFSIVQKSLVVGNLFIRTLP